MSYYCLLICQPVSQSYWWGLFCNGRPRILPNRAMVRVYSYSKSGRHMQTNSEMSRRNVRGKRCYLHRLSKRKVLGRERAEQLQILPSRPVRQCGQAHEQQLQWCCHTWILHDVWIFICNSELVPCRSVLDQIRRVYVYLFRYLRVGVLLRIAIHDFLPFQVHSGAIRWIWFHLLSMRRALSRWLLLHRRNNFRDRIPTANCMRWQLVLLPTGLFEQDIGSHRVLHCRWHVDHPGHPVSVSSGLLLLWGCFVELSGREVRIGWVTIVLVLFRCVFSGLLLPSRVDVG